ncbi:MAG TPA: hypothetical protein VE913_22485 [Longimicrobium sp.]|nr:hypothetical protein [Longimicrobium sp.]
MRQHIDTVAWVNIGLGVLGLMVAFLAGASISFAGIISGDAEATGILMVIAAFVVGFITLLSVPQLVGGWALLRRKAWGRPMVLLLSFLNLLNFPLGTMVGGYSLWVLMSDESRALFSGVDPRDASPREGGVLHRGEPISGFQPDHAPGSPVGVERKPFQ